jgi:predicted AAA+ superfamily ATPase
MIQRELTNQITRDFNANKALIILGPRQVGKTTLIENIGTGYNVLFLNGDDPQVRLQLENASFTYLSQLVEDYDLVFIDEAQRINNLGLSVKMLSDAKIGKQIVITGSSSLDLGNKINEPLTGRKFEYQLFPLSWFEVKKHFTFPVALQKFNEFLIFGMYPEVVTSKDKRKILIEIAGSYLYKDILELGNIKKPDILLKLLNAVALQLGNEVSYNELSNMLRVDRQTVTNYLDLLEKSYVIFRLHPFSTNQRNEITSKPKIYFYDNGIRNAIIGQFNSIENRVDQGALFENFIISEKIKRLRYDGFYGRTHYWRNTQKAEIDFIEHNENQFTIYEIKYSPKKKVHFSSSFTDKYKPQSMRVINRDNFWEFL